MSSAPNAAAGQKQFPCKECGANLHYAPGTETLICPFCGATNEIPKTDEAVQELDFRAYLAQAESDQEEVDVLTVKCVKCGAESTLGPNVTADVCPFCGAAIVATAASKKVIKPGAVLPFFITREQAAASFRAWIASLWFAPSGLRKLAQSTGVKGVYIPAWTYDSDTTSDYTGRRGDDYWETETYTEMENGHSVTKTRQVQRTRWSSVSGTVSEPFDDLLVLASQSLPRKQAEALEPWDLKNMVPYSDAYLSGFISESYQLDLAGGFEAARGIMDVAIRQLVNRDIGGDHQEISSLETAYFNITFKHTLLPIWVSAYLYLQKSYRFLVNARTGEVQGERPWSAWKIAVLVLSIILAIVVVLLLVKR